jgi:hypothetical protein
MHDFLKENGNNLNDLSVIAAGDSYNVIDCS